MGSLLQIFADPPASGSWLGLISRATLVLVAAWPLASALCRASASTRHLVWASTLAGSLALPLLMLALPPWPVPILPRADLGPRPAARGAEARAFPGVPSPGTTPPPIAGTPAGRGPAIEPRRLDDRPPGRGLAPSPPPAVGVAWPGLSRPAWVVAAWGIGAVVVLLPMLAARARLRRIERRSSRVVDGPLADLAGRLGLQARGARRVVLLRGDATSPPMTWGVMRPVILLPDGAEGWDRDRLRAVLSHELAHVGRLDCLTQMMARLACAAYWFHPLAWMAARRLRAEAERACDDLVLRSGSRAADYAGHLLEVARALRPPGGLSAAAIPMARASQLEGRLRAILDRSRDRRAVSRRGACLLFAAVGAALVPLSTARLGPAAAIAAGPAREGDRSARMVVDGRVLDPAGRPVGKAKVAVLGRRKLAAMTARAEDQHAVLGRAESDAEGRFRLEVPRTSSVTHYDLQAVASAPGLGLGWAELNRDAEAPTAEVRLAEERPIEGRLVDLQGAPAPRATLWTSSVGIRREKVGQYDGMNFWRVTPKGLEDLWPAPVVTDDEGRFRLSGLGRGTHVGLRLEDRRFARQSLAVEADDKEGSKEVTLAAQPAMLVSGRVTRADSGKPMGGAIVVVGSGPNQFSNQEGDYRTDADGRYEANPAPGKYLKVTVYPPVGEPYVIFERNFEGEGGEARRVVDVSVPRGVLLTGRVTERGGGPPLAGAAVYYNGGNVVEGQGPIAGWMSAVSSDAEGRYAIAVTPGKGNLLVYGPTADFVHEVRGDRDLSGGKPGGARHYAHAFLPYEVEEVQGPVEIPAALTPGVTVAGRVVGPEGQAVDRAEIVTTLSISPFHTFWRGDFTIPVREGRFELHGVPPGRPSICSFLDAKNGWGATLAVTAEMAAGGPLTVKLQPCGEATARLVDERGRPVAKSPLNLDIIGTPGPGTDFNGETLTAEERAMLAADEEIYANVDRVNYWEGPRSDRDGRITLPKLIPGATYRIYEYTRGTAETAYRWRDFTVEAGRTTDLGDVRVKKAGG